MFGVVGVFLVYCSRAQKFWGRTFFGAWHMRFSLVDLGLKGLLLWGYA